MTPPSIVLDQERVVVVDKPAGITSEDAAASLGRRLVHRIDRATSGLLVLADDARTVQRLQRLFAAAAVQRRYLFVAHGAVVAGPIQSALTRDRGDGLRGAGPGGKASRTDVVALRTSARATLGVATLVTGRTHQVRIHLAESGHPIVGERVYVRDFAGPLIDAPRLLLHAWRLAFVHPSTKLRVVVDAPAPPEFKDAARAALTT